MSNGCQSLRHGAKGGNEKTLYSFEHTQTAWAVVGAELTTPHAVRPSRGGAWVARFTRPNFERAGARPVGSSVYQHRKKMLYNVYIFCYHPCSASSPKLGAYLTGRVNSASPGVEQDYKLLITIR
jgi:hypothetical protein